MTDPTPHAVAPPDTLPDSFHLASFTPYRLNRLASSVSRLLSAVYLQRYDLTRDAWRVLAGIAELDQAPMAHIMHSTGLEKMQASRAVALLAQRGFLDKHVADDDRRGFVLQITPLGRTLFAEIAPMVLEREAALLSVLNEQERQQLDQLLHRLQQQADALARPDAF